MKNLEHSKNVSLTEPETAVGDGTPETKESANWEVLNRPAERMMIVTGVSRLIERIENEGYDTLIFMDKSARPLYQVMASAYKELGQGEPPQTRFLSVDTKQKNLYKTGEPAEEMVTQVRENYFPDPENMGNVGWGKVLVIDERKFTGKSARATARVFEKAFCDDPQRRISRIDTYSTLAIYPTWNSDQALLSIYEDSDVARKDVIQFMREKGVSLLNNLPNEGRGKELKERLERAKLNIIAHPLRETDKEEVETRKQFRTELEQLGRQVAYYRYYVLGEVGTISNFAEGWFSFSKDLETPLQEGDDFSVRFPEICEQIPLPAGFAHCHYTEGGGNLFRFSKTGLEEYLSQIRKLPDNRERLISLAKLQVLTENGVLVPNDSELDWVYCLESALQNKLSLQLEEAIEEDMAE